MSRPRELAGQKLFAGLRVVSLFTLLSRILGLVRDIGMAALFGNGVVMDAFSVAFRVPNLARRLFGEGALTAAFLPVFVRQLEQSGRQSAWSLASSVFCTLTMGLTVLVLLGELALWGLANVFEANSETELLLGLSAVMLPYAILICLAAQISAVLHALGHFTWPALLPIVLNVGWIACLWLITPTLESAIHQIYSIALCITLMGLLQLSVPVPTLYRQGFRFEMRWQQTRDQVLEITRAMLPVLFGLSVTQLNSLCDSLIAWGFSQPEAGGVMPLPGHPPYPLQAGTASALFFGQRMYQFPLGVFGVALGTVLFPLLSRHAGRGQLDRLRDDLSLGIRLVVCVGLPASAGLVLLAQPLVTLFFQYGAFGARDAEQTAAMIAAYGMAVWAYSGLLIVHRGYYALGDRQTPLRIGLQMVGLNFLLNVILIWFLGGSGLAFSTALCAILQFLIVTWRIQIHVPNLDWRAFGRTTVRALAATAVMSVVCLLTYHQLHSGSSLADRLTHTLVPVALSVLAYFATAKSLGLDELWLLFQRDAPSRSEDS